MDTHIVVVAKLKPDDPEADQMLDDYEMGTRMVNHRTTAMTRSYALQAPSLHAAKEAVKRHLPAGWEDRLAVRGGDND
jgi:hypothetical protein